MLSLYRHFLTAQLAATSLVRNNAPLVEFLSMHKRTPTRTNWSAGVGAHAENSEVPRPFSARAPLSLPRAAHLLSLL